MERSGRGKVAADVSGWRLADKHADYKRIGEVIKNRYYYRVSRGWTWRLAGEGDLCLEGDGGTCRNLVGRADPDLGGIDW